MKIDYDKLRDGFKLVFVTKSKPHEVRKYEDCLLRSVPDEIEDKSVFYFSVRKATSDGQLRYQPRQCKKCLIIELTPHK